MIICILLAWIKLTYAASSSAASWRFHLFLRFWNQILTWVSVRRRDAAKPARSDELRYLGGIKKNENQYFVRKRKYVCDFRKLTS